MTPQPVWETHPVTPERFEDFADVINKNRRQTHCWCVSHRLTAKEIAELGGDGSDQREQAMRALCEREHPPGVITYLDGDPVGWCNIGPRSEITRLNRSKLILPTDDLPVWSIVCVVVRSGYRKRGVTQHLIDGAVDYARANGAPAVEAHPVDPPGRRSHDGVRRDEGHVRAFGLRDGRHHLGHGEPAATPHHAPHARGLMTA